MRRRPASRRIVAVAALLAGAVLFAQGLWIPVKAEVAQVLLERAWRTTVAAARQTAPGEEDRRTPGAPRVAPWSWADTWPVARLTLPEAATGRGGRGLIVLASTSGEAMAFGPGMRANGEMAHEAGDLLIAGHRDTHFAALRHLAAGQLLHLELPGKAQRAYRVGSLRVVHRSRYAPPPAATDRLTLVTCWPFDALVPGGPLRLVVEAERVDGGSSS
ncbi:MAG: class GN sortase [Acidobacteria bacterium]|nr:MAG: class GN sortase [Acidobacteriota bacterium]REK08449.1 MAG: class GN sortase [Acidobacteriota bacterium]